MSDFDRENILAQREDEKSRAALKSQLDQMVKDQSGRKEEATRGSKRMHAVLFLCFVY